MATHALWKNVPKLKTDTECTYSFGIYKITWERFSCAGLSWFVFKC